MPTEELKFEDLIQEFIKVIESTDIDKLKEENRIIKVDIERKQKEEKNIDVRIEEIQAELESLDESSLVEVEEKETRLEEVEDFKEKKQKEIKELRRKERRNNRQIRKANNIGKNVINKAEEKTNKANEELQKKIEELKERKSKFGIKRIDKDGKETIQLTKEEKIIVDSIDNDIKKLDKQIRDNRKEFLLFKKNIEEAQKSKETYDALKKSIESRNRASKAAINTKDDKINELEEDVNAKDGKSNITKVEINTKDNKINEPEEDVNAKDGKSNIPKAAINTKDGKSNIPKVEINTKDNKINKPEEDVNAKDGKSNIPKAAINTKDDKINEPEEDVNTKDDIENESKEGENKSVREGGTEGQKKEEIEEPNEEEKAALKSEEVKDYERLLEEYKRILVDYEVDLDRLYQLQNQYENGEIEYSQYDEYGKYISQRYGSIEHDYNIVKAEYDKLKQSKEKFIGLSDEELNKRLKELDEETTELWQEGVHEGTPDAKRYHEALKEINDIKEELSRRSLGNTEISEEEYQKALEEYNKLLEKYKSDYAKYEKDLEEYNKELDEYNKALEEYNKEKAEYSNNIDDKRIDELIKIINENSDEKNKIPEDATKEEKIDAIKERVSDIYTNAKGALEIQSGLSEINIKELRSFGICVQTWEKDPNIGKIENVEDIYEHSGSITNFLSSDGVAAQAIAFGMIEKVDISENKPEKMTKKAYDELRAKGINHILVIKHKNRVLDELGLGGKDLKKPQEPGEPPVEPKKPIPPIKPRGQQIEKIEEPEKPHQPMFIMEKEKENPPQQMPVRSGLQVYRDVLNEVGYIRGTKAIAAHDFIDKFNVFGINKLVSGAMRLATGRKKEINRIVEILEDFPPEDFELLVNEFILKDNDTRTLMEHKVNEIFLLAMEQKCQKDFQTQEPVLKKIEMDLNNQYAQLAAQYKNATEEEKIVLREQMTAVSQAKTEIHARRETLEMRPRRIAEGREDKSYDRKKNIKGGLRANRNPDNRKEINELADIELRALEAKRDGRKFDEAEALKDMEAYRADNTEYVYGRKGKVKRSIGAFDAKEAEVKVITHQKNMTPELMGTVAMILTTAGLTYMSAVRHQQQVQQQVDAAIKNAETQANNQINAANQALQSQQSVLSNQEILTAQETLNSDAININAIGERTADLGSGFNFGATQYPQLDATGVTRTGDYISQTQGFQPVGSNNFEKMGSIFEMKHQLADAGEKQAFQLLENAAKGYYADPGHLISNGGIDHTVAALLEQNAAKYASSNSELYKALADFFNGMGKMTVPQLQQIAISSPTIGKNLLPVLLSIATPAAMHANEQQKSRSQRRDEPKEESKDNSKREVKNTPNKDRKSLKERVKAGRETIKQKYRKVKEKIKAHIFEEEPGNGEPGNGEPGNEEQGDEELR